jgi:hypothetical protein
MLARPLSDMSIEYQEVFTEVPQSEEQDASDMVLFHTHPTAQLSSTAKRCMPTAHLQHLNVHFLFQAFVIKRCMPTAHLQHL